MITYRAGAPWHPGTNLPRNVTGECPHRHRTPQAAQRCIDELDRSIKNGHGAGAYCDRVVMAEDHDNGGRWVYEPEAADDGGVASPL
jgi:hypothetical protein